YVVHGWLHLASYDDLEPAKKRKMRAAEARAMKLLHAASAVPAFTLSAPTGSRSPSRSSSLKKPGVSKRKIKSKRTT
ncbi:MAG: rRNA maturation RNAse YbeY, partial [Rariglobus sp.]